MVTSEESGRPWFQHDLALVESEDIGPGTRIWPWAHVMPDAVIGADCNIGEHAFVESGVVLGDRVTVKNGVCLWEGIKAEDDVFFGPNAVLTNDSRPRSRIDRGGAVPTLIRRGASIGANATLLCGITVGRHALIGAGAVVTKDVMDHALVVGNPARHAGWVCVCAASLPLVGGAEGDQASCPECSRRYVLREGRVERHAAESEGTCFES
jgi:UDP-2-acetamido-3-amino-2,3-dideoxy-glucuronate N-acetyltransferase